MPVRLNMLINAVVVLGLFLGALLGRFFHLYFLPPGASLSRVMEMYIIPTVALSFFPATILWLNLQRVQWRKGLARIDARTQELLQEAAQLRATATGLQQKDEFLTRYCAVQDAIKAIFDAHPGRITRQARQELLEKLTELNEEVASARREEISVDDARHQDYVQGVWRIIGYETKRR